MEDEKIHPVKKCSLFIRGTLGTESIVDMIPAIKTEKNKKRTRCWGRALVQPAGPRLPLFIHCLLTTAVPQETGCTRTQNDNCWQQTTSNSHCSLSMHLPLPHAGPPCCFHAREKTQLPPTASTAREGVPQTATDLQHLKSNLPLGFQFSVWICSPLSLHRREAGSSF